MTKMYRKTETTLQGFSQLWSHKHGIIYVVEEEHYDKIWDYIEECISEIKDVNIFDTVGCSPLFALWETDVEYSPIAFLKPEYANCHIQDFIIIPSGILVFVDYEEIEELRKEYEHDSRRMFP